MPLKMLSTLYVLVAALNWHVLKGATNEFSPIGIAFLSNGLAAFLLAILAWRRGELAMPRGADWLGIGLLGAVQTAAVSALVLFGLQHARAGEAALLLFTNALWGTLLGAIFLHEALSPRQWIGLGCAIAGLLALIGPAIELTGTAWLFQSLILCAALLQGIVIVAVRGRTWGLSSLAVSPWQAAIGATLLGLWWAVEPTPAAPTAIPWPALLWNATLGTAFAIWAGLELNRSMPVAHFGMLLLAVPAAAMAIGLLSGLEEFRPGDFAGMILIGWGTWLGTRSCPELRSFRKA